MSFSARRVVQYLVQNRFQVSIIWLIKSFISWSAGHVTQGLCRLDKRYIAKLYHETFWILLEVQFRALFFELHLNFFCDVFLFWVTLIKLMKIKGYLLDYSCIATTKRLRKLFQKKSSFSFSIFVPFFKNIDILSGWWQIIARIYHYTRYNTLFVFLSQTDRPLRI